MRGEDFIEGFWDGSEWLYMIIWGVLPGLAAAASRFEYQGQLWPPAAALCPDSKRGEDQLPALLVPAERGKVLFIKERYLAGDMGVKNVRTSQSPKTF